MRLKSLTNPLWVATKLGILAAFLIGCAVSVPQSMVGKQAPAYTPLYLLDRNPVILEEYRGTNVVLLFWEYKCAESHKTIEALNSYIRNNSRARNVTAFAISLDKLENLDRVRSKISSSRLDSVIHVFSGNDIYDEAKVAYDVTSLPSIFVIDSSGMVLAVGSNMSVVEKTLGRSF